MVGAFAAVTGPMWALRVSPVHASSQACPGSCVTVCQPSLGAATSPPGPGPPTSKSLRSVCGTWPHHSPVSAEASRNQADGEGFPLGFAIRVFARSPLVGPRYCGGVAIVSPYDTYRPTSPISASPRAVPSRERAGDASCMAAGACRRRVLGSVVPRALDTVAAATLGAAVDSFHTAPCTVSVDTREEPSNPVAYAPSPSQSTRPQRRQHNRASMEET